MKMRMPIAFMLAGLAGAGGIIVAMNATAQQFPQSETFVSAHEHGHEFSHELSESDKAAFFDARIAALHAGLTLTPDQEKLWPAVETALRGAAKTMADRRKVWKDEPHPADPVQLLQRASETALARGDALKKLADAAAPLYGTLNDEQKHRLPILLAHLHPHHAHFAMMEEHRPDQDGESHGWPHDHHRDGDEDYRHGYEDRD